MHQLFQKSHPLPAILLPVLVMLLNLPYFLFPAGQTDATFSLLNYWGGSGFSGWIDNAWLSAMTGVVIITIQAFFFNALCSKLQLFGYYTLQPALIFALTAGFLSFHYSMSLILTGHLFLLISVYFILQSVDREDPSEPILYAGMFLSFATWLYSPYFWFLLFLFMCLITVGKSTARHLFLVLTGFLLPWLFAGMYFFAAGAFPLYFDGILAITERSLSWQTIYQPGLIAYLILFLYFITGFLKYIGESAFMVSSLQLYHRIFQWCLPVAILQLIFSEGSLHLKVFPFILPFTIYITFLFNQMKDGVRKELAFWFFMLSALALPWLKTIYDVWGGYFSWVWF